jgi:cytochrome c oxidase cbb3-type subunit 1
MTSQSNQTASLTPGPDSRAAVVSEIDFSCRLPLLILFISASKWLVIGWIFELIASIKFHSPALLADYGWLTYGRVHAAFSNSLVYGFCIQAGLGVVLWLLAQLGATTLAQRWLVTAGAIVWNLGVTLGVIGILLGDSTGFEHLEMPGYAAILVFVGYLLMALCGAVTFHQRRDRKLSVSHWFLFSALFWFPWIYSTANLLLLNFPVRGVAQAVVAWWFSDNLLIVWLSLVGLGTLLYFIPRLAARELYSRYLAMFAFWMLILLAGWGGIPGSAPVPAWMPALSTVGTVLFLLGIVAIALNLCETAGCSLRAVRGNVFLSFFFFGVVAFALAGLMRAGVAVFDVNHTFHFTWFGPGLSQLNLYGFFAMVMFGAVYFIMPRLLGVALPWPRLVRAHFWIAAAGVLLLVLPLMLSGFVEELKLENSSQPFLAVMRSTLPFLRVSTIGDLLLLTGHVIFLANLTGLVVRFYRARAEQTYAELTADLFKTAGARS